MKLPRYRKSCVCACRCRSFIRNTIISLLFATALLTPVTRAQRNITIYANDPDLTYTPHEAWKSIRDQSLGDGNARTTLWSGSQVTLTFEGTAIYFQTTRAKGRGLSTIELDEATFELDSSLSGQDTGDTGVMWGIVSLKDTKHTITVTQSAADGVELAINTFIYTTNSKDAIQKPLPAAPVEKPEAGFLDPSHEHFKRNIALVAISTALALILILLVIYLVKTYRFKKHNNISKASIRLALSPDFPTSSTTAKSFRCSNARNYDLKLVSSQDSSVTLHTPTSAAFLLKQSASFGGDSQWPATRTISLSSSVSYAPQEPQAQLQHKPLTHDVKPRPQQQHHHQYQEKPRFTLPSIPIYSREPSEFNPSATAPNTEPSSPIYAVGRASSELEHDNYIPPVPDLPSSVSGESEQRRSAMAYQYDRQSDGLTLTTGPRSPSVASNFSATFP